AESEFRNNHLVAWRIGDELRSIRSEGELSEKNSRDPYVSYAAGATRMVRVISELNRYFSQEEEKWSIEEYGKLVAQGNAIYTEWSKSLSHRERQYASAELLSKAYLRFGALVEAASAEFVAREKIRKHALEIPTAAELEAWRLEDKTLRHSADLGTKGRISNTAGMTDEAEQ